MEKIIYRNNNDKILIDKAYRYLSNIIIGSKNTELQKLFDNLFNQEVDKIVIHPFNHDIFIDNGKALGFCRMNDNGKLDIEICGSENIPNNEQDNLTHRFVHEFCHAFVDVFQKATAQKNIQDGIVYKNSLGLIKMTDAKTGKLVGKHYIGKMLNETMMDIISAMAINIQTGGKNKITINDMLENNYKINGNSATGYTIFTSITRLVIMAFANAPLSDINYQKIAENNESIFMAKITANNGQQMFANDFLYGIVFDHSHIQREFNKVMGTYENCISYELFAQLLDVMFIDYFNKKTINKDHIKLVMEILPDFCNKNGLFMKRMVL